MKRILILAFILMGAYVLFFQSNVLAWWSIGEKTTDVAVTENVDLIDIDVAGASTNIIPDSEDTVRAELEGKGKVIVKKSGDTIKVELKRKWFNGFAFFNKSKLTVYIPEDYSQDLRIDVGSGNVNFAGPSKRNPMELEEFTLDIGSGNVQIDGLTTKKGSFDISSGNVDLHEYSGELNADVSSGNLDVLIDELIGDIKMDVSSGRVNLDLPKDADFTLDGEVSSGNIESEFPLDKEDKNSIQGKNGSGRYNIDLDVSSGNIVIH